MNRNSFRIGLLISLTFMIVTALKADTLILRDGRRVDGQLTAVNNGVIDFEVAQPISGVRNLRFTREQVAGIEFSRRDENPGSNGNYRPNGRGAGLRERQVMVAATAPWTDTNIDVRAGQDIYFQANGEVGWGPNRRDGPAGEQNSPANPARPIPNRPGAALIGRVGGNSTGYFYVGAQSSAFRMRSSGRLFLGINDDYLQDNSGAFLVVVYY
jgi:hypothetical protein